MKKKKILITIIHSHALNEPLSPRVYQESEKCCSRVNGHYFFTYLRMLTLNVRSQAISAISNTEARAFCRVQMVSFLGLNSRLISAELQEPPLSDRLSKAKLRFAESKTIKKISKRTSRALERDDLRPNGLDVYSSHVM